MWFLHPCYLPPTVCYLGTYSHIPTCSLAPCAVHPPTIHPSVYLPTHPFTCLLPTPSPPTSQPSTNPSVHLLIYPPSHPSCTIHPSPRTLRLLYYFLFNPSVHLSTPSSPVYYSTFPIPSPIPLTPTHPSIHVWWALTLHQALCCGSQE